MRHSILVVLLLGALGSTASANPALQDFAVGVSATFGDAGFFHTALSPYGEWLELDAGFYAWRPSGMHSGWRPYLHGHWSWTRFGWYWVSSEPFGWAVFHYGRWYYDDYYGWMWVPDQTWGPSWVEWRYDDDCIGWAPLPPYASFSINFGIRFTTHWFAPHRYWSFVRYRHFTSPYLYREVMPMEYTRRLIGTTRSAGRYEYDGERVINRGVDRSIVERRGGYQRLEPIDVQETNTPQERQVRDRTRERIETYRPEGTGQERSSARIEARRIERGTSLELQRIERAPREVARTPNPTETDRGRGNVREESRSANRTTQPPAANQRQDNTRRAERRIESSQAPSTENRQIDRRREERSSSSRQQQMEQKRPKTVVTPERSRQERREVTAPRTRTEQSRPAPSIRKESPRGSEQGRKEGGRKRN